MFWVLSAAADKVIYSKVTEVGHPIPQPDDWVTTLIQLILITLYLSLFVLVGYMAHRRNRDELTWPMVAVFTTPFPMILLLLILGKAKDKKKK